MARYRRESCKNAICRNPDSYVPSPNAEGAIELRLRFWFQASYESGKGLRTMFLEVDGVAQHAMMSIS